MNLSFPLATAVAHPPADGGRGGSGLGKRDSAPSFPFNATICGNGGAVACKGVAGGSARHGFAPNATKRARLEEEAAAARADTATDMPPPVLPPLRLPCDEPNASVFPGGHPPVPPPHGELPAVTEPLMPISIALWPHSGPAAAGAMRLPPLPRMDWLAPGRAVPRAAAAAAGSC